MQSHHPIHAATPPQLWPRCTKVEIRNGSLLCVLDVDRQYDLVDAYRKDPHIQFLDCKSVDDLQKFTRAWGPLYLVQTPGAEEIKHGQAVRRVDECLAHVKWLRAVQHMIDACNGRADWRASLLEFLAAESDIERTSDIYKPGAEPLIQAILRNRFRFDCDPATWAASTSTDSVRRAVICCVELNVTGTVGRLKVEKKQKGFEFKPYFSLPTLWDALNWMLWFDRLNRRPPRSCLECRRIFRPLTAHEQKYCSQKCAHRVTNREWRRKDLRRRKREARKRT
jgi:hypothetical protein